jgi:hypothetical protein
MNEYDFLLYWGMYVMGVMLAFFLGYFVRLRIGEKEE